MSIAQVCCCVLLTAFAIGVEEAGAQGGVNLVDCRRGDRSR